MILVDDGSTDGCPAICDAAAEQDDRVRVIHQKNGGLSRARNAGLDAARGEWIGFVDSDDCIHPDMYEKLLAAAEKNDADMAICNILQNFLRQSIHGHTVGSHDMGEHLTVDISELSGKCAYLFLLCNMFG